METKKYAVKVNQELSQTDEGVMKVQFKIQNSGSGNSYNTKYSVIIQPNLTYIDHFSGAKNVTQTPYGKNGQTLLTFDFGAPINAGELRGGIIYLRYSKYIDSFDLLTLEQIQSLPTELKVTQQSSATMDLTAEPGQNQVTQILRKPLTFPYTKVNRAEVYVKLVVSGRRSNPSVEISPIIKHAANETDDDLLYTVSKLDKTQYKTNETRRLENVDINDVNYEYTYIRRNRTISFVVEDYPGKREVERKDHIVTYNVLVYNKKTNSLISNQITYDQDKIGLSTTEVVLILLTIALFAGAALFIWFGIKNLKLANSGGLFEKKVRNTQLDRLVE